MKTAGEAFHRTAAHVIPTQLNDNHLFIHLIYTLIGGAGMVYLDTFLCYVKQSQCVYRNSIGFRYC